MSHAPIIQRLHRRRSWRNGKTTAGRNHRDIADTVGQHWRWAEINHKDIGLKRLESLVPRLQLPLQGIRVGETEVEENIRIGIWLLYRLFRRRVAALHLLNLDRGSGEDLVRPRRIIHKEMNLVATINESLNQRDIANQVAETLSKFPGEANLRHTGSDAV